MTVFVVRRSVLDAAVVDLTVVLSTCLVVEPRVVTADVCTVVAKIKNAKRYSLSMSD